MNLNFDDERGYGDFGSFLRIFRYARPYWRPLWVALAVLGVASFASVLSARALGRLVEFGLARRDAHMAWSMGGWILVFEVVALAATYFGRKWMADAANGSLLLIRHKLFSHLNELPMRYFDREPLGKTVTRLAYDVEGLEDFFGSVMARLLSALLTIGAVTAGMLATDVRLGLIVFAAMMPAAVVTWASRGPARHWNREFSRRNSAINATLSEFLNGIPVIRYFGAERWSAERFDSVVDSHLESAVKINVLNSWIRPTVLVLCALPLAVLLYFGGRGVIAGGLSLGVFVAFIRFTERFSRPISQIAQEVQTIQTAFTSAERVSRFLDQPTETSVLGPDGTRELPRLHGELEFRGVEMGYGPEVRVLKEVSFRVAVGEKIGLAGRTGSGKTTTAALLSRLYEFQGGDILVDQVPIREIKRESLRSHIGFVSQDVTIFRGTLAENLAFGTSASPEQVMEATRATGLDEVLRARQVGLDLTLLDQGSNLSAGERQLVALTRVLLRDPSLLILDEATSNVDEACERLLQDAVLSVMKGRTCLMIAHRLSTLQACDRILVFRGGEIVEQGPHAELMERQGYYAELLRESRSADAPNLLLG